MTAWEAVGGRWKKDDKTQRFLFGYGKTVEFTAEVGGILDEREI